MRIALRGPVQELLHERPVAVVAPEALLDSVRQGHRQGAGLHVAVAAGLDDLSEVDRVLSVLAAQRESYDAVLIGAMVPGKILAARLARELGVVALEFGITLGQLLHPRFGRATVPVATARWEARRYLELIASGGAAGGGAALGEHPLNGRLVRVAGRRGAFYVERGTARPVARYELLADRVGPAIEVSDEDLDALPRGPRVLIVHERLTGPYVLLDGRCIPVDVGLDVVEVGDLALAVLPEDPGRLAWEGAQ